MKRNKQALLMIVLSCILIEWFWLFHSVTHYIEIIVVLIVSAFFVVFSSLYFIDDEVASESFYNRIRIGIVLAFIVFILIV
ncbi:hypothetical protein [Bacillus massiliigorillae]|uniref:hypothetical protein n=1 Tax=Bacillus massiliigorillae TaxID=1243664 RepID=UPI00039A893B|nr:hypothetical protein [Bacillus massiliigorillae]